MNKLIEWAIQILAGISASQWSQVVEYVLLAVTKTDNNAARRLWVIDKMQNLGLKGSVANFLVEAAVTLLKRKKLL